MSFPAVEVQGKGKKKGVLVSGLMGQDKKRFAMRVDAYSKRIDKPLKGMWMELAEREFDQ